MTATDEYSTSMKREGRGGMTSRPMKDFETRHTHRLLSKSFVVRYQRADESQRQGRGIAPPPLSIAEHHAPVLSASGRSDRQSLPRCHDTLAQGLAGRDPRTGLLRLLQGIPIEGERFRHPALLLEDLRQQVQ